MTFDAHLASWDLTRDGDPIITPSSQLLPVRSGDVPAMLKIAVHPEEQRGAILMDWWDGEGAAPVLAREANTILLERATGARSLTEMARSGRDDEASRIICEVAARLQAARGEPRPELVPLTDWFCDLWPAADHHGGILRRAADVARALLADPRDVTVLHGDMHHGNILDFGARGWLAIDPKGLVGERGFDFANTFTNPDSLIATQPGRLARQATIIAGAAGLDRTRLLRWVLAYCGLSAAWFLGDGNRAAANLPIAVAELAIAELGRA
jgi:streptomycin 6-kinase